MPKFILSFVCLLVGGCTTVRQLRQPDAIPVNGTAEKTRSEDALDYSIAIDIAGSPEQVWAVLIDAKSYPSWNTNIVSLEGTIELNGKLKLRIQDVDRTFKLKVTTFEPHQSMVWEDGNKIFMGVRNFTLIPHGEMTTFVMSETFSGGMLGMIEGKLPDFSPAFEGFAQGIKQRVEAGNSLD